MFGTPVLASRWSGIARMIRDHVAATDKAIVRTPDDLDEAATRWAHEIGFQLCDRDAAFACAGELSENLARAITWENSIDLLLKALSVRY